MSTAVRPQRKGKLTKRHVNYRMAEPNGPRCGICVWFNSDIKTCDVVSGTVRKGDVCDRFTRKPSD